MDTDAVAGQFQPEEIDPNKLGMTLFLISEGVFFAFLITSYVFFHGSQGPGPNARNSLDPAQTGIYSVLLLASSFTMRQAEHGLRRSQQAFRGWLAATLVLGVIFLFGQGREYARLYRGNVTVDRNLFGTTFFTLTGFHGLHVLLGLVALAILLAMGVAGSFEPPRSSAVETVAMFWHFVDWVWVVIFGVVYVWALF